MYAHAQRKIWQKEAGGELFANDPDASGLVITSATGPNPLDRRSRCSWNPDTVAADQDRRHQYLHGRHAVGLWHTHPEPVPSPSDRDQQTAHDYLNAFHGERKRYLMVTVGNRGNPPSMTVWAAGGATRNAWSELVEASASDMLANTRLEPKGEELPESE